MSLNPGQRGGPTQQIFIIFLEEHAKARPAANGIDMDGDALRQCLVQFKPGTAHMPVRGDQTHRAIAALFDPMGRFDGVGTGVDCLVSQSDAAIEQFRSEEHTSELQSLMRISYAVFCLKTKNNKKCTTTN